MALKTTAFALLLAGLAACSTTQSIRPVEREPEGFSAWSDAAPLYRLGAGDRLRVDFLLTPEMGQDAVVEQDGFVSLRSAGRVRAQNLTAGELEAAVTRAAAANLKTPVVSIAVTEARAARIVVGGAVQRPGVYPLTARASTLEAVMQAGGFMAESRMDEVVVIRQRPDGPPMLRTVDLRGFVSRGKASEAIALASEDIVFVPRSRVSEANLWVEKNIDRMLPFSRSVSYGNSYEAAP